MKIPLSWLREFVGVDEVEGLYEAVEVERAPGEVGAACLQQHVVLGTRGGG